MTESEIFNVVRKLPDRERDQYLNRVCSGDVELIQRVKELLDAYAPTIDVGSQPLSQPDELDALKSGDRIGPFKLLQLLGRGGMGEVWMAEQSEPVKRRVALKVIKRGIGSQEIIARFEAERQALALMNHPNIARILDAGTTSDSQPWIAMELVQGKPLTTYCDENKLGINERLELFSDICSGVQHAHQKGIIHRDLKPGNILVSVVDGKAVAKVIDFGLAKAMESTAKLTEQSLFTGIGQILGTFKYMSPEQASLDSVDVDTRTDIYALGVILYELLTGSTPLDDSSIKGLAALKILEFIRDREAVKPSSKLSSSTDEQVSAITGQRKTDKVRLNRILAGDLDWIVMKALEKDRTRRYESASGFAADIRRYLNSEPVIARPPSLNYRIGKFVRKNRVGVIAASLVTLALVGGIIGTTSGMMLASRRAESERIAREKADEATADAIQARKLESEQRQLAQERLGEAREAREAESKQRKLAEVRREDAEQAREIAENRRQEAEQNLAYAKKGNEILGSVFTGLDPKAEYATVAELRNALRDNLQNAVEQLEESSIGDPLTVADMQMTLSESLLGLGEPDLAIKLLEQARETRTKVLGANHPDTLTSMNNLASGYHEAGQLGKALPLYEGTFEKRKSKLGPDHPDSLRSMNNLAMGYLSAGQLDKALPMLEQTLVQRSDILGPDHSETLESMNNLATGYYQTGRLDEALSLLNQSMDLGRTKFRPNHPKTLRIMNNLAMGYLNAGRLDKALPMLEQTLAQRKTQLGPDHHDTLRSVNNLALGYYNAGQLDKARPLLEQSLKFQKSTLGSDHPDTMVTLNNLAMAYFDAGQPNNAIPLLEQSLAQRRTILGRDHPQTLASLNNLAWAYLNSGQLEKAIPLLEQTLELSKSKLGPDHPQTLASMNNLALAYSDSGHLDKALPLLEKTMELMKSNHGFNHPNTISSMSNLASAYREAGKLDKALALFEDSLALSKSKNGSDHPSTLTIMSNLAVVYNESGQTDKALSLYKQTLEHKIANLGPDHPSTLTSANNLALAYQDAGKMDKALALFEQAALGIEKVNFRSQFASIIIPNTIKAFEIAKNFDQADSWRKKWQAHIKEQSGEESVQFADTLASHGQALLKRKEWSQGEEVIQRCLTIREKLQPDAWPTFNTRSMLGAAQLGQKKYTEAEPLLLAGYEGMKAQESSIPPQAAARIPESLDRLIELYTALDKPEEADRYRKLRNEYPESIDKKDQ